MTTITLPRATVEQALEALESVYGDSCDALHALRAALAQQAEPKPMSPEQRQRWEELAAMPQQAEPVAAERERCAEYLMQQAAECRENSPTRVTLESCAAVLRLGLHAQAEPVEPYCYVYEYDGAFGLHREFYPKTYNGQKPSRTVPVYTAPPQRKPLMSDKDRPDQGATYVEGYGYVDTRAVRAVERAHGIGEQDAQV